MINEYNAPPIQHYHSHSATAGQTFQQTNRMPALPTNTTVNRLQSQNSQRKYLAFHYSLFE